MKKLLFCKSFLFLFVFYLCSIQNISAQKVSWYTSPPSPSLDNVNIGVLGDDDVLHLRFAIVQGNLSDGKIELTLPNGVKVEKVEKNSLDDAGTVLGNPAFVQTGTKVEIPVKSITSNKFAYIDIILKANDCSKTGAGNVAISVLSKGVAIPENSSAETTKKLSLNVVIPSIVATPAVTNSPALDFLSATNYYDFTLPVSVSNGVTASSIKIEFTVDKYTELTNIKFDGKLLTFDAASTETKKILIINTPITSVSRNLTFRASAQVGGSHTIASKVSYPLAGSCGTAQNFPTLTLSYQTVAGKGYLKLDAGKYFQVADEQGLPTTTRLDYANNDVLDGKKKFYAVTVLKNDGTAPITALDLYTLLQGHSTTYCMLYAWNETGDNTIYYRIGSETAPLKTAPVTSYAYSSPLPQKGEGFVFSPEAVGKPRRVDYSIYDIIPAGSPVYIYIPVGGGKIYDNALWDGEDGDANKTVSQTIIEPTYTRNSIFGNTTAPKTIIDVNAVNCSSGGANYSWTDFSVFSTYKDAEVFKAGETKTVSFNFAYRMITGTTGRNISHIQLPPYLNLKKISGTTFQNTQYDAGTNTTTFEYSGATSITLQFEIEALPASQYDYTSCTAKGEIRFWNDIDFNKAVPSADPSRTNNPVWTYFNKRAIPVTVLKNAPVVIDQFKLNRITRGLEVQGTSGLAAQTPKSTNPASDTDIDHNTYLEKDAGQVKLNVTVKSGGYNEIYVELNSRILNKFNFKLTEANNQPTAILDDNSTITGTLEAKDGNIYVRYRNAAGFNENSTLDISIPFVATTASDPISIYELFGSVYGASDPDGAEFIYPENISDWCGADQKILQWRTTYLYGMNTAWNENRAPIISGEYQGKTFYAEMGVYRHGTDSKGYTFPREYRPYMHPQRIHATVPKGMNLVSVLLQSDTPRDLSTNATVWPGNPNSNLTASATNRREIPISEATYVSETETSITYAFDLKRYYDFNALDAASITALNGNKWIAPNGIQTYRVWLGLKPTPQAPATGTITAKHYYAVRPDFSETETDLKDQSISVTVTNYCLRGVLTVPTTSISAYSKEVTVPSISTGVDGPVGGTGDYPTWLYVEGVGETTFSDLKLVSKESSNHILNATGNGRWIRLTNPSGADLQMNKPANWIMRYTLNDLHSSDKVRAYLVSGFGASYTPDQNKTISELLSTADSIYVVGYTQISSTPVSKTAKIQGKISVPSVVSYKTLYNVDLAIDSKNGSGDVVNPIARVAIPEGQKLTSVTYKNKDNPGSWIPVPEAAYKLDNQILTISGSKILPDEDFVLSGNMVDEKTDADRVLNIRLGFNADCETSFTGFTYSASFSGSDMLGNAAIDGTGTLLSSVIYTDITNEYLFEAAIETANKNYAFGGNDSINVLKVGMKKAFGVAPVESTDYLELTLPKWLDIAGDIMITSGITEINAATILPQSNKVIDSKRTVQLLLPAKALNMINKVNDIPFTYNIPLKYTPTKEVGLKDSPEQVIKAEAVTLKRFNEVCPLKPFPIGNNEIDVALITFEGDPFSVCAGSTLPLKVASVKFSGAWYEDLNLSRELKKGASFDYTPSSALFKENGKTTFFVKTDFGAIKYGKISVDANIIALPGITGVPSIVTGDSHEYVCSGTPRNGITFESNSTSIEWTASVEPLNSVTGFSISGTEKFLPGETFINHTDSPKKVIYAITAKNNTGCLGDTTYYTVTVYPSPVVQGKYLNPVPVGVEINLADAITIPEGTIAYYYADEKGTLLNSNKLTHNRAGIFTYYARLLNTQSGCMSDYYPITIRVEEGSDAIYVYGSDVCVGSKTTFKLDFLNGVSGGTGNWLSSNTIVAEVNPSTGEVTGKNTGTFRLVYKHQKDGFVTMVESNEYNVYALPLAIVQDTTICSGTPVQLSSLVKNILNGDHYAIYTTKTGNIKAESVVNPTTDISYYVEALKSSCNCSNSERTELKIKVNSQLTFDLSATGEVCEGGTFDLRTVISDVNISNYKISYRKIDSNQTVESHLIQPSSPVSDYYVSVQTRNGGCISEEKLIRISYGSKTQAGISMQEGDKSLCVGTLATLITSSPVDYYQWSSSNPDIVAIASGSKEQAIVKALSGGSSVITYKSTDASGCQVTGSYTIVVNALPEFGKLITHHTACEAKTVLFSDLVEPTPGNIINIYDEYNQLLTTDRIVLGNTPVTLKAEVENLASGCTSGMKEIHITPMAKVVIDIVNPDPVCLGSSIDLRETITDIWNADYDISYFDKAGNKLSSPVVTPRGNEKYYIRVSRLSTGCESQLQPVFVTVNELPKTSDVTFGMVNSSNVCAGQNFELKATYSGKAPWTITYTDGINTGILTSEKPENTISGIQTATTYRILNIQDGNGCINDKSNDFAHLALTVSITEPITITRQPESTSVCVGGKENIVVFTVEAKGAGLKYQWYDDQNQPVSQASESADLVLNSEQINSSYYYVIVSGTCNEVKSEKAYLEASLSVIHQIRNHTLVVNNNKLTNGGYEFTYYYWYKNGELIQQGAHDDSAGTYYNENSKLDPMAIYHVVLIDSNGKHYRSCDYIPTISHAGTKMTVYPNPANISGNGKVTVSIETNDENNLKNGQIQIYDMQGSIKNQEKANGAETVIQMPSMPGIYMVRFISESIDEQQKVIVK